MSFKIIILAVPILMCAELNAQTNNPPIISLNFPDSVIIKQNVTHRDSIFALPLVDFGTDADGDSLIWTATTQDSIIAFLNSRLDTLYVHSQDNWFGRGTFRIRLEDLNDGYHEKEIPVTVFKSDGTLLSKDGTKTEYYIPWHPILDLNRIAAVEKHMKQYGKDDLGLLDKKIHWSRWKKLKFMKGAHNGSGWLNDIIMPNYSKEVQFKAVDHIIHELRSLNVEWIEFYIPYFMESLTSNEIIPRNDFFLPTWTNEDIQYVNSVRLRP